MSHGNQKVLDTAIQIAMTSILSSSRKRIDVSARRGEDRLLKLYHVTGDEKYYNLTKFFLDERGNTKTGQDARWYAQDHKPVAKQTEQSAIACERRICMHR